MTRKLDLAFRFGGDTVAGGGTISPGADGAENVAIASAASAFENQRAVHKTVGTNDEADFYLRVAVREDQ